MTTTTKFDDFAQMVDSELKDLLDTRDLPLYDMMVYHMGWDETPTPLSTPAQRSHGVLGTASAMANGCEPDVVIPAAAAVELVDKFCEIHDDVQGGKPKRGDRDAVWWVWGPAQAINTGDGMHAMARLSLFRLLDRGVSPETAFKAVQLLDEASLLACEGRFIDLQAQERVDMTSSSYLKMASDKAGALYGCAAALGALIAGANSERIGALERFGTHMGAALLINTELRQLDAVGSLSQRADEDLMNKKKSLPVVLAFENSDATGRRKLGDYYFKRVLEPDDLPGLSALVKELGGTDAARGVLDAERSSALAALDSAGLASEGSALLSDFFALMMESTVAD
ncbi:MAG: polyprenyl synthetase family protein [SAR202 cluster bacterium]|nr:polyprenyl synthetase family protein [SAR202 cluster bacterium]MDP6713957.1 polyprenyl synthetase family protein [SAR202 cluster bacterium]